MARKKRLVFETACDAYAVEEQIGQGGTGRVFRARDTTGNLVAVKQLNSSSASSEKRKRFKNELNFCLRCRHSNIVPVLDHGIHVSPTERSPFYVMPLYACSLRGLLQRGIPPDEVLPRFGQILDGVEAAHLLGAVHRDLKPENILKDERNDRLVVADFGIAHFAEDLLLTAVETAPASRLANFQYAAPEQRVRGGQVSQQTDIYALGLLLNEMFTNEVPWGTDYALIGSGVDRYAYLDDLVRAMIRQRPDDRPASVALVKQELIGRGNEFVSRQRLSELSQTVVTITDLDDPLVLDPPRLVNFDWRVGELTLLLSQPVNALWTWALNNMGSYQSVYGKGPDAFRFAGNKATVRAAEDEVQRLIDHVKSWLPRANQVYEERVRAERRKAEEREREKLRAEVEAEERRQRLLRTVKI